VVGNEHHTSRRECPSDPACGVRQQQGTNSKLSKHPDRKSGRARLMTLVQVEPATLRDDVFPRELSSNQLSPMSNHGWLGEARNVAVWNRYGILNPVGEKPQSRPEHDSN
jgi:hypothetical protein